MCTLERHFQNRYSIFIIQLMLVVMLENGGGKNVYVLAV